MKRLLVTGVSGLLGLNLACLAADRFAVVGAMRGERAAIRPQSAPFETILVDLTQPGGVERMLEQAQPDIIIHCAALTNVDHCEEHPDEAFQINTETPRRLAYAAAREGIRLVHISTDAVFDGRRGDYSEADEPCPINIYGRSKLDGEHAVADVDPDALIARVNFYGWSWQGSRSISEWFFHHLAAGNSIGGFTDIVFCPLLVNELVEVLLWMVERNLKGLYHVASRDSMSKFAFGRLLAREFGYDEDLVTPASYKNGGLLAERSPLLSLRTEKLAQARGCALPDQETGMRQYHALYQQGYPRFLQSLFVRPGHSSAG